MSYEEVFRKVEMDEIYEIHNEENRLREFDTLKERLRKECSEYINNVV